MSPADGMWRLPGDGKAQEPNHSEDVPVPYQFGGLKGTMRPRMLTKKQTNARSGIARLDEGQACGGTSGAPCTTVSSR